MLLEQRLLLLLLLGLGPAASPRTLSAAASRAAKLYFSASSGSGAGVGDEGHLWKTMARLAQETLQPGSSVFLHAGDVWAEPMVLNGGAHRVPEPEKMFVEVATSTSLKTDELPTLSNWHGAMSIHAANSSDTKYFTKHVSPPLCISNCSLVSVASHGEDGDYYHGSYSISAGAGAKSAGACKTLCLATLWCVQLTFVASNPASACVLYSKITTQMAAPTPLVQAWVKCSAGAHVAGACAHFSPAASPPVPPAPPPQPVHVPAQMLRKRFMLWPKQVTKAILITSSTGFVQSYINGQNIAPTERLNPGRSSLDMRQWYLTYNVTEHLQQGANCVGFLVGRGWQYMEKDAAVSAWGGNPALSAHRATVKALLLISFANYEKQQYIVTDTTWVASVDGVITSHDIYGFEVYDARKGPGMDICPGGSIHSACYIPWATASFAAYGWSQAEVLNQYPNALLSEQIVPPIRQLQLNKALSVTSVELRNGTAPLTVYVFDMGQNTAGSVRLAIPAHCPAGHTIIMYFSEVLYKRNGGAPRARVSGPPSQGTAGTVDQSNLLGANARAEYICSGSDAEVWYEPTFTYFGYRYVELVGYYPGFPTINTLQQRVLHSDVENGELFMNQQLPDQARMPSGNVDLGNPLLNSISSAVRETLASNLFSVPTDCPQRSERWGWMADGSLSAEANYHYHWPGKLYASWLTLMQDVQKDRAAACIVYRGPQGDSNKGTDGKPNCSGSFGIITPGISPLAGEQALPGDPSWAVAFPLILSYEHRYSANTPLVRSMFHSLCRYVSFLDWMARSSKVSGLVSWHRFGDWLSPRPSPIVNEMSSAFNHAQAIRIARDTAMALSDPSASSYVTAYATAQRGFHAAYWRNGTYGNGEQASLVYALYLGSPPADKSAKVLEQLVQSIVADSQCRPCLFAGILSTKWMMETLSLYGRTDVALSLALKASPPSWGHMVLMNSTTITESWSSVDEIPPLRTSRNHPALASVGAWYFRWVAGLRLADNSPGLAPPDTYGQGFARVLFAPGWVTDARVPYARARLTSPLGQISSYWEWDKLNRALRLNLTVPSRTKAQIWVPTLPNIAPQNACVIYAEANASVIIWQGGRFIPHTGITGVSTVSPNYITGGGDGRDLISISVATGSYSFVVKEAASIPIKMDDTLELESASQTISSCPPDWEAACPDEPCVPLNTPDYPPEVVAFHADYPRNSWKYYNLSIITTIITDHHETNLSCTAHKHGVKVVYFGFNDYEPGHLALLHNESYRKEFVRRNINDTVTRYPWIDGINIDLEHFSSMKSSIDPDALTSLICEIQAGLHARGLRLHSQDVAVRGSYGNFNVTALAECMDYILPMAYCAPASSTVAGPTIALDELKRVFAAGSHMWEIKANKIILGLPFFGYNFECLNAAPVPFPLHESGSRAPACKLAQPPRYPMIDHWNVMQIFTSELKEGRITSPPGCRNLSACVGFDAVKAAAWFEYRNHTTGRRHQIWFENSRSVHAKSQFAFTSGLHGVAFWRGNEVFGPDVKDDLTGKDSEDAQAMWRAADPRSNLLRTGGGYGGRGYHYHHGVRPMRPHMHTVKMDNWNSSRIKLSAVGPRLLKTDDSSDRVLNGKTEAAFFIEADVGLARGSGRGA